LIGIEEKRELEKCGEKRMKEEGKMGVLFFHHW
jgi:hypothetical protein